MNGRIAVMLGEAYVTTIERADACGISARDAAYDIAIERVIEAALARGLFRRDGSPETGRWSVH